MRRVPRGTRSQLVTRERTRAHRCPRDDGNTQRSGRFGGSSSCALLLRGAARGVGTHDAELQIAERASSTRERTAQAVRPRGGREPGGVRYAECAETGSTEAGDG